MKKILITGANSYIGTSFEHFMAQWPEEYRVDTVDMVDGSWRECSFAGYDSVFHVTGIAHQDAGKITEERKQLYFKVNTELTVETAKKAKANGVKQFIFMSSINVYGVSARLGQTKMITMDTKPAPSGAYGMSKLKAEEGIFPLNDNAFHVCVLRPPMIYGPGCKGNYSLLREAAMKLPFIPDIRNERSMLYIKNLLELVRLLIINNEAGIYWPQNEVYSCTDDLVKQIAAFHHRKLYLTKVLNPFIRFFSVFMPVFNKVFGNLTYHMPLSEYKVDYRICSYVESIEETEQSNNSFRIV